MDTSFITKSLAEIKEEIEKTNDLTVLADKYGAIKNLIDELSDKADLYNEALKARMNEGERAIGLNWTVLKSQPKPQSRLDAKKLEEDLGKETLAGYYKPVKNSPRLTVDHTKLWEVAA